MKTQKRAFIVEYKNPRRRSVPQPKSIWGDTDFKALTRDASQEAEELFAPVAAEISCSALDNRIIPPEAPGVSKSASNSLPLSLTIPDPEDAIAADCVDRPTAEPSRAQKQAEDAPHATLKRGRRGKRTPVTTAEDQRSLTSVLSHDLTPGELDALIAENDHLKNALNERLSSENTSLKAMLSRFS